MLLMGLFTAFAFFIFVMKLPTPVRQKALGFDLLLDIAATIAMMLAFAGSYDGMAAAIVGGLIFSSLLIVAKKLWGYDAMHWHSPSKRFYVTHHRGLFSPRTNVRTTANGDFS